MDKKPILTKILAIAGTVLLWFPILAMVVSFFGHFIRSGRFLGDYLLPAELFLVVAAGAALLLWAALRAKTLVKPIMWGMIAGSILLVGGQLIAMLTGLASGEREAVGFPWILVLGAILLYDLVVLFLAIIGIRLWIHTRKTTSGEGAA